MRLRPLRIVAALLICLVGLPRAGADDASPQAAGQAATPLVTATRQQAFTIPFRIEPAQTAAQEPLEVQLHVSANAGRTWELAGRVPPARGSFVFRAPHDGEYWFTIRTVDRQGVARPETLDAQLKVVVDTIAPRLDLVASRGAAGEVVARWQAVDPNLKPQSFKLEYQSPSGTWERVAVESPPGASRYTFSGQTTWWPPAGSTSVAVRAEVSDAAGNPASSQAVVRLSDGATASSPTSARTGATPTLAAGALGGPTSWPPDRSTSASLGHVDDPRAADRAPADSGSGDSAWRALRPPGKADQQVPAQTVSQSRPAQAAGAIDLSLLPAGERPRMVGARTFDLEYEIDAVGPSGVAKVELWATTDGGRSWSLLSTDADNRSPMPVRVETEGLYGFRITVQSGNGLGGQAPVEGDAPELWVGVDLTKPTARITAVDLSPDATELAIQWEASDELLDSRPVSLSYSAAPSGPWTPIAGGLENGGSYRWQLDSRLPPRIFVKLEVRDEAGNVAAFQWPEPVSLDRSRPEGHIRGVKAK